MAKKRSPVQIRQEELDYTWGCRKRDPRFIKDYDDWEKGILDEIDLCNKWALGFVPANLNGVNPLGEADVPVRLIETLTESDTATLTVTSKAGSLLDAQWNKDLSVWDKSKKQWVKGGSFVQPSKWQPHRESSIKVPTGERRWIVEINPSHPLRLALQGITGLPWRSKGSRAKKNIDIRFAVYDRHHEIEESFSSIAFSLNKSVAALVFAVVTNR